jgi:inward rectifier potassium channel
LPKRRRRERPVDPLLRIQRLGMREAGWNDIYHKLLTVPVSWLLVLVASTYLVANLVFAMLYVEVGGIAGARPGSVEDAFFFSVQTMATIGYGHTYPVSTGANVLATIESVYGLLTVALSSGVMFARFSRPTARVMFSKVAVICPVDGVPMLVFRVANQRRNRIVEAQISVAVLREERTHEGIRLRRFHDLALVRSRTPMFALTWSVMHPIDEASPLYGIDAAAFQAADSQVVCSITGLDDTSVQTVHARHVYEPHQVWWGKRLVDIFEYLPDGRTTIDYSRFHDTMDVPLAGDDAAA